MTPAASTPVIGYCRVSTDEQHDSGLGLDAQEAAIRAAATARGWDLVEVIREVGSAKSTTRRPLLNAALASLEIKDGPKAVVVAKLDRLTRSVADGARLFERAKDKGWGIVALDLGVDTTTPAGELVANVMVAVGQWERKVIGERTSAALRAKVARGERVGRPRTMPEATLERIRALRAAGATLDGIASRLNEEGIMGAQGGRWHKQSVHAAVRRYAL